LHRLTGIPWIADFRDPMTEKDPLTGEEFPSDPSVRRINRWIERPTVARCARAVFTTTGTLSMYEEHYPDVTPSRWTIVANGYDEEDFVVAERLLGYRPAVQRERVVLVHSGLLYPEARNPRPFFASLAELRRAGKIAPSNLNIILRASGHEDRYRRHLEEIGIDDIVTLEPALPYHEALVEMLQADGLLIFQAASCNWQIPAKTYECLRAGRPIFALTDPSGDTAGVLKAAGIDTVVPLDSTDQIARGLIDFLNRVRQSCAPIAGMKEIEAHSRRARTKELAKLLDACVNPSDPARSTGET
jgi:hypothetical protein